MNIWSLSGPASAETTNQRSLAVWDSTVRATVGGGYRANVLRSGIAPQGSAFIISSADASFIRLAESGQRLSLLLLADDVRFTDAPAVNKEQLFAANAQALIPAGEREEFGAELSYFYQNQVLDVSDSEVNLYRVLAEGHDLNLRLQWTHQLTKAWSSRAEGIVERQLYEHELDDFWEGGGRWSLLRGYGYQSEFSIGFESRFRFYDTRRQYDRDGHPLNHTGLVYWRPEVGGEWRHYWDAGRHWRTTARAAALFNRDNGPGYFDYDRIRFSQQLRWKNLGWEIKTEARFSWHFHHVQRVNGERRERSSCALGLRAERQLSKHWLLYAAAEREWNFSNDRLDEYRDWMASAGVGTEF